MLLSIYSIILKWFLFEKCGEQGWKSLIPFYNTYTYFKLGKAKGWGIAEIIAQPFLIVALIVYYISFFGVIIAMAAASNQSDASAAGIVSALFASVGSIFLILIATAVSAFKMVGAYKLGKQFNLDTGFLVGMVLIPIVFESIITFSAEYRYYGVEDQNSTTAY